ncbi:hypothetical protein [Sphingomonas jaspsi]|uniref:hypothetical protein n=1 Tax=Sphingomonas jaspsi TaxID=392409 RepID=UPI0004B92FD5|nr:hypothetical protein [Sphingomonas jaspsi]
MSKLYSTLYKSVLRAVNELVKDIQSTVPGQADLQYWAWESRMDEDKMPRVPLLGVNGFSFEENSGLWLVRFGLTISTVDDANLLEEADIIDMIHSRFGEKRKIALVEEIAGEVEQTNELVCVHCEVLPMGQTQVRNYRSIGVEVLRTGT